MITLSAYNLRLVKDHNVSFVRDKVFHADESTEILLQMCEQSVQEKVCVICLNKSSTVIATSILAQGGADCCGIMAKDILRFVLKTGADAFILGHNHPSGNADPSLDDIRMTINLKNACDVIGISFLDHIIVADFNGKKSKSIRDLRPEIFRY